MMLIAMLFCTFFATVKTFAVEKSTQLTECVYIQSFEQTSDALEIQSLDERCTSFERCCTEFQFSDLCNLERCTEYLDCSDEPPCDSEDLLLIKNLSEEFIEQEFMKVPKPHVQSTRRGNQSFNKNFTHLKTAKK